MTRVIATQSPRSDTAVLAADVEVFERHRPRLIGIAWRIVGRHAEAEDVVQDVWLRWQACDRNTVVNPTAFLVTATTRMAINASHSARARRERCVQRWPCEPIDTRADRSTGPERSEALHSCMTVLSERLSPAERGAYVLRHAFSYPYTDIARVLRTSESNARQLVSRAKQRMAAAGRSRTATTAVPERLIRAFTAASELGEVAALEDAIARDAADSRVASSHPSTAALAAGQCVPRMTVRR